METELPRPVQAQQPGFGYSRCGFCYNSLPRLMFDVYEKQDQFYRACPECSGSERTTGYRKVR